MLYPFSRPLSPGRFLPVALLLFMLGGCEDVNVTTVGAGQVSISPPSTFVKVGETTQLNASVLSSDGQALAAPTAVKTWFGQRRAFLVSQLGTVAAPFNVTGANFLTVSSNLVTLSGTAPIRVKTIEVNGVPWPVIWTSVNNYWDDGIYINGKPGTNNTLSGTSQNLVSRLYSFPEFSNMAKRRIIWNRDRY